MTAVPSKSLARKRFISSLGLWSSGEARREHLLNCSLIFDSIRAKGVHTSQGGDCTSTSFGLVKPSASKQRNEMLR